MIFNTPLAPLVRYTEAAIVLDLIEKLVDQTDITRVHWAQFMDSSVDTLGVVSLDGHRRAAYNAFKLYAMMPVDRRAVTVSRSSFGNSVNRWVYISIATVESFAIRSARECRFG